ncbi:hypothetical protein GH733_001923, partial [Mirounga leonina]
MEVKNGSGSWVPSFGLLGRSRAQLRPPVLGGSHGEEGSAGRWKALSYSIALASMGRAQETPVCHLPCLHMRAKRFPWGDGTQTGYEEMNKENTDHYPVGTTTLVWTITLHTDQK